MRALLRFFGLTDGRDDRGEAAPVLATTTLGPGIRLKGELQGEGALEIFGVFEGDIVLNGTLRVGPEGQVDGNVTASSIVIAGSVHGNLSADTRVDILASGSLTGTVRSASFAAADGATVKGEVWVERAARPAGAAS